MTLSSGEQSIAKVVGIDAEKDVAVLQIDKKDKVIVQTTKHKLQHHNNYCNLPYLFDFSLVRMQALAMVD